MLTILDWLKERQANCIRIAKTKQRQDRQGWLEDAAYFQAAIEAVVAAPQVAVPAPEPLMGGVWRCQECGDMQLPADPQWRWAGDRWQHHHGPHVGHVDATYFGDVPPVAEHPDTARLNWLESRRLAYNMHYGTAYGWKFVTSPMVNRLFVKSISDIDLNDAQSSGKDIRSAIDVVRAGEKR